MSTYLLTWNPNAWKWTDFDECVAEMQSEGTFQMRWSTGVTQRIVEGDRCFLMRLGAEPKGILASGFFCSETFVDNHWSGEKGRSCLYADIEFDVLVSPFSDEILPLEILKSEFPAYKWTPQASGQSIPETIASQLEKMWSGQLAPRNIKQRPLWEGAMWRVVSNRRERNPFARQKCINHYGLNCAICGFNFQKIYGDIGEDVIHVHHLEPLGLAKGKRKVDPIRDLRPVCANCHLIIHKRKEPYTIQEMKGMLEKNDDQE